VARAHQITAHHTTPGINSLLQNQFSLSDTNQPSTMSGMSFLSSTAPAASGFDGVSGNPPRPNARQPAPMTNPMSGGWAPSSCHGSSQLPQQLAVYSPYTTTPPVSSTYDADTLAQFSTSIDLYQRFPASDNPQSQATVQNNCYELDAAWQRFVEQMGTV